MTESKSLLPLGFAVLGHPLCDVAFAPHAALREFGDGLGEADRAGELVGSLAADAEHLADFGGADEFHGLSLYPLTLSSASAYTPLDSVKGGTVMDPYRQKREEAAELAAEFEVDEDRAFHLILGFGSRNAARKHLIQEWWRGNVELRANIKRGDTVRCDAIPVALKASLARTRHDCQLCHREIEQGELHGSLMFTHVHLRHCEAA